MRATELTPLTPDSKIIGSVQLYVPRHGKINEVGGMLLKPTGTTWTSTAIKQGDGYTSDWVEWLKNNMPQWLNDTGVLYRVRPGARILSMNTDKDAFRIAQHYGVSPPKNPREWISWSGDFPWNEIKQAFDAVHHVPASRMSNILMNSWDAESTAWFNTGPLEKIGQVRVVS